MGICVEFLGTRGSLPTPYPPSVVQKQVHDLISSFNQSIFKNTGDVEGFMKSLPQHMNGGYGGNTSCVSVTSGSTEIYIDGGTGIRYASERLMHGPCAKGQGEVHILMTHFHWDHVMGLPFFGPIYVPGNKVHFYAVQSDLPQVIQTLFSKPFFPVPFSAVAKNIHFHQIEPRKPFQIGDLTIAPYQLDHPDPCWGYRVESGGRVYAHCVDTEGTRVTRAELGEDLPLYQGVDLMYFDAQYTVEELKEKINWGHSSVAVGLEIALREGIKRVIFAHHDPGASDDDLSRKVHEAVEHYDDLIRMSPNIEPFLELQWFIGIEGMKFDV